VAAMSPWSGYGVWEEELGLAKEEGGIGGAG